MHAVKDLSLLHYSVLLYYRKEVILDVASRIAMCIDRKITSRRPRWRSHKMNGRAACGKWPKINKSWTSGWFASLDGWSTQRIQSNPDMWTYIVYNVICISIIFNTTAAGSIYM